MTSKDQEYAAKIIVQIQEMFDEDCENHIDLNELEKEDNAKQFLHALLNDAPAHIANKLLGKQNNILDNNHLANTLVLEFINKED